MKLIGESGNGRLLVVTYVERIDRVRIISSRLATKNERRSTSHKLEQDESDIEDMLEEYDFSNAKPGRHKGFKGKLIRVLSDNAEQVIELERDDHLATPD